MQYEFSGRNLNRLMTQAIEGKARTKSIECAAYFAEVRNAKDRIDALQRHMRSVQSTIRNLKIDKRDENWSLLIDIISSSVGTFAIMLGGLSTIGGALAFSLSTRVAVSGLSSIVDISTNMNNIVFKWRRVRHLDRQIDELLSDLENLQGEMRGLNAKLQVVQRFKPTNIC